MKRMAYVKVWKQVVEKHEVMRFEELSEEVQEKLIREESEKEDPCFWDFFDFEIKDSWNAIADHIGCRLNYSYDLCGYSHTDLNDKNYGEFWELDGVRAMKWIFNNWIEPLYKGKYITASFVDGKLDRYNCVAGTKGKDKYYSRHYYSKVTKVICCPFTGFCYDNVLIEAYKEFMDEVRHNSHLTVEDFVETLGENMTKCVMKEAEYRTSDEYHKEELIARENWYFENGEIADVENVVEVA